MPVDSKDIIKLLCTLAEEQKLRVTLEQSLKGGLITGLAAAAGGIAMGPVGLAVGGAAGGCLAAYLSHSKFLPVVKVIEIMEQEQREQLAHNVKTIMDSINVQDVAVFAAMIAGDLSIRTSVMESLVDYLRTEMSLAIVD